MGPSADPQRVGPLRAEWGAERCGLAGDGEAGRSSPLTQSSRSGAACAPEVRCSHPQPRAPGPSPGDPGAAPLLPQRDPGAGAPAQELLRVLVRGEAGRWWERGQWRGPGRRVSRRASWGLGASRTDEGLPQDQRWAEASAGTGLRSGGAGGGRVWAKGCGAGGKTGDWLWWAWPERGGRGLGGRSGRGRRGGASRPGVLRVGGAGTREGRGGCAEGVACRGRRAGLRGAGGK